MKRYILILAFAASFLALSAQPRAVGLRLGSALEFSYEHTLGANMLSLDAGLCYLNGAEVAITYDWINPGGHDFSSVWSGRGQWNWYAGVGGAGGFYWDKGENYYSGGFVGVAGRLGVEYNFWFPLQLSFDYRPVIGVGLNGSSDPVYYKGGLFCGGIALGVRYRF